MIARWSDRLFSVLSAQLRRGALFVLALVMAGTLTLTPALSSTANAQFSGLTSLLGAGGSLTDGLSSCAIETVGWVICPTMRSIARLADYGFTYINSNFLRIDYSIASNSSGTYRAWELMRNVADALFVVAFMFIVYSQLTGRGGGYNLKRLLPKLIISAILVNISYYICIAIVDVVNIIGDSLMSVFNDVASRVGTSVMPIGGKAASAAFQDGTLTTITSSVLGKTGVAWVLLAPVAAVVISIATICAAGLVLLIMRKTVIAMLILGSPILFVAYLLPNLERFFFQGVRLFIQLLLLYPIIALLLGAGQIVSSTIVSVGSNDANYRVSGDSYFAKNGGSGSAITDLTAAAAAVVPLLGVWFIFKNMSQLMNTAGARLSASVSGRRGGKDDDKAKVTGNAVAGAAKSATSGIGNFGNNRRQAFSRNRKRSSLGGSSQLGEAGAGTNGSNPANRPANTDSQNALQNSIQGQTEDLKRQLDEQGEAKISGDADGLNIENAVADAIAQGSAKEQENKKLTAKDLFNNINKAHDSKDKDRKFSSGPAPAGSGGNQQGSGGPQQPSAPGTSYKAPQMAQGGNIVTGTSQQPVKIVAVPVQIDASSLIGQSQNNQMQHPPENISQPPISGTEEKAKERAQRYLYDAQRDVDAARDKMDILGSKDAPTEPPHTDTPDSKNNGGS